MKRIGSLLFLVALIWTWNLVHSESKIPFSTHVNIQMEFRELLLKSIKEKRPEAQNIQISELWTKDTGQTDKNNSEVEVYVTYSFETPDSEGSSLNKNEISAIAILKKDTETNNSETWILESYKPTRDDIQFTEGFRITAGTSEESAKNQPEIENSNPPTEPNSSNDN